MLEPLCQCTSTDATPLSPQNIARTLTPSPPYPLLPPALLTKTHLRLAQVYICQGNHAPALTHATHALDSLLPSTTASTRSAVKSMHASLHQITLDITALKEAMLTADKMIARDPTKASCDRLAIAAAMTCSQHGGSLPAAVGVAAAVSFNVCTLTCPSVGDLDTTMLTTLAEGVAKAVHYLKGDPAIAAVMTFGVFTNSTVWPDVVTLNEGDAAMRLMRLCEGNKFKGAGIAAALVASLRNGAKETVVEEAKKAVVLCGGSKKEASEVAKIFDAGNGEDDESSEEESDVQVLEEFTLAEAFQGKKDGFVFKTGDKGLGYYTDVELKESKAYKKKMRKEAKVSPHTLIRLSKSA